MFCCDSFISSPTGRCGMVMAIKYVKCMLHRVITIANLLSDYRTEVLKYIGYDGIGYDGIGYNGIG